MLLVLLVFHDFLEKRDSGSDRYFLHWISLDDVLDRLQLVVCYVTVELVIVFERLLIFHVVNLTPCGTN